MPDRTAAQLERNTFTFTDEEVEELAEMEHDRWWHEKLAEPPVLERSVALSSDSRHSVAILACRDFKNCLEP